MFLATVPTVKITLTGSGLTVPMTGLFDQPSFVCAGIFSELACNNPVSGSVSTINYSSLIIGNV